MSSYKEREESKIQTDIIKLINCNSGYVYKNAQNLYTEKGRPDLTACIPATIKNLIKVYGEDATIGLFIGIEVKATGCLNEVSEAQHIVGRKIIKANGLWLATDNIETINKLIINFKGGNS